MRSGQPPRGWTPVVSGGRPIHKQSKAEGARGLGSVRHYGNPSAPGPRGNLEKADKIGQLLDLLAYGRS